MLSWNQHTLWCNFVFIVGQFAMLNFPIIMQALKMCSPNVKHIILLQMEMCNFVHILLPVWFSIVLLYINVIISYSFNDNDSNDKDRTELYWKEPFELFTHNSCQKSMMSE